MNKEDRLEIANKFLKIISDHGRRFFFNKKDGFIANFKMKNHRIYFVDDYTKKEIYLHYRFWGKGFSHGGTLKELVKALKEFIMGRQELPLNHLGPWRESMCGGDLWGYKDSMEAVRQECKKLIT